MVKLGQKPKKFWESIQVKYNKDVKKQTAVTDSPLWHPSVVSDWPLPSEPAPSWLMSAAPRFLPPDKRTKGISWIVFRRFLCFRSWSTGYLSTHESQSFFQLSQLQPLSLYLSLSLAVDFAIIKDGRWSVGKLLNKDNALKLISEVLMTRMITDKEYFTLVIPFTTQLLFILIFFPKTYFLFWVIRIFLQPLNQKKKHMYCS